MTDYQTINFAILIATVIAIIAAPIAAVWFTRKGDLEREKIRRKSEILSTLMRTRPARLSFEHVGALNLVQLDFHGEEQIQKAYRSYMAHLNMKLPNDEDSGEFNRFIEERNDRFVELLYEIGSYLGYHFDKRDLQKLAYGPLGWSNDEDTIRMLRTMSLDVLSGRTSLPVMIKPPQAPSSMFPPPPSSPSTGS